MGKEFDVVLIVEYLLRLLQYLPVTLTILAAAMALGCVIGVLTALVTLYKVPVLDVLGRLYVSFFRGIPTVVQLMLVFYGIPEMLKLFHIYLTDLAPAVSVVVTFGLSSGAFLSESFRAAINGVDRGQLEAALSIGLSRYQGFRRIVLPQALRIAMPNIGNTVIASLKDTSLAFSVGVLDMVGRGETIGHVSYHLLEVYIALGVIYYGVSLILEFFLAGMERRLQRHDLTISVR
jgi:L-cystine transport system permease protein